MVKKRTLTLVVAFGLIALGLWQKQKNKSDLIVLAYPSFASALGPGPQLVAEFSQRCRCKVEIVNNNDGALGLEKLKAMDGQGAVDVAVGLDALMLSEAKQAVAWADVGSLKLDLSDSFAKLFAEMNSDFGNAFVPFDWAPLTLVANVKKIEIREPKPLSLKFLFNDRFRKKILLQDARLSTPGLQFAYWMGSQPDAKDIFENLRPQVFAIAPSWSKAYGLFQKNAAPVVFTYLTSVVYHWQEDNNRDVEPLVFDTPHPVQVEVAGVLKNSRRRDRAREFLHFLLEPGSQALIMKKNYMLPVIKGVSEGTLFAELPEVPLMAWAEYQRLIPKANEIIGLWQTLKSGDGN